MGRGTAPISVLVVEDEVLISNLVADVLSASGFVVHEVTTADEALQYIELGRRYRRLVHRHQFARQHERRRTGGTRAGIAAGNADRLRLWTFQAFRNCSAGAALALYGEALRSERRLRAADATDRRRVAALALHAAAAEELFQPMDVIVAIDDVVFAHQCAKEWQCRFDAIHHQLVERAF